MTLHCPVHVSHEMTEVTQHPPSWVAETPAIKRKHGKKVRTILRCPIENCFQVGFEFDPEERARYFCSRCGKRMSQKENFGIDGPLLRVPEGEGAVNEIILLRMSTWDRIRGHFSQEEKDKLNSAICGETICPRGVSLDAQKLGQELAEKIKTRKVAP